MYLICWATGTESVTSLGVTDGCGVWHGGFPTSPIDTDTVQVIQHSNCYSQEGSTAIDIEKSVREGEREREREREREGGRERDRERERDLPHHESLLYFHHLNHSPTIVNTR